MSSRNRTSDRMSRDFRLPLLAEEEHVVPGEDGDVDLGDDGVVVADDAGEEFVFILHCRQEIRREVRP